MTQKISRNENFEYIYDNKHEENGEYVVDAYSNYSGELVKCLFFDTKEQAIEFINNA